MGLAQGTAPGGALCGLSSDICGTSDWPHACCSTQETRGDSQVEARLQKSERLAPGTTRQVARRLRAPWPHRGGRFPQAKC